MRLALRLRSLLSRKSPANEWDRLRAHSFRCSSCDQTHDLPFDIAFAKPDIDALPPAEANSALPAALAQGRDFISTDFCLTGGSRLIRSVLPLQIRDTDARFCFGTWSSVNPDAFHRLVETFDSPRQGDEIEPMFSWLCNDLRGAPSGPSRSHLRFQNNRQRPEVHLEDPANPYTAKQQNGITVAELLEIYALYGHALLSANLHG